MQVIADFCLIPLGVELSLSPYVAQCQKILAKFSLKTEMHAYGTNLEGEWDEVLAAVKACHEELHRLGVPRISTSLKLGTRIDKKQSMKSKVDSVNKLLKKKKGQNSGT